MGSPIGDLIARRRRELGLTQDKYGKNYDISGPAVFKIEKGYVNPSFRIWMQMARDLGLSEVDAVVLFAKCKVPEEWRDHIGGRSGRDDVLKRHGLQREAFGRFTKHESLREAILAGTNIPQGLRALAEDTTLWEVYRPTGREIDRLLQCFGPYGNGSKALWHDDLAPLNATRGNVRIFAL